MEITLYLVSQFLDLTSIVKASRTCKQWRKILYSETVLKSAFGNYDLLNSNATASEVIESLSSELPLAMVDFFESDTIDENNFSTIFHLSCDKGLHIFQVERTGRAEWYEFTKDSYTGKPITIVHCENKQRMLNLWYLLWSRMHSVVLCTYSEDDIKLISKCYKSPSEPQKRSISIHSIVKRDNRIVDKQRNQVLRLWGETQNFIQNSDSVTPTRQAYIHIIRRRNYYLDLLKTPGNNAEIGKQKLLNYLSQYKINVGFYGDE